MVYEINKSNDIEETINNIQNYTNQCFEITSNTAIKIKEQDEKINNIEKKNNIIDANIKKIKNLIKNLNNIFIPSIFFKKSNNLDKNDKNKENNKTKCDNLENDKNKENNKNKCDNLENNKSNKYNKTKCDNLENDNLKNYKSNKKIKTKDKLDNIINTIHNIKSIGIEISDKLNEQNNVLDEINKNTENITNDIIKYDKEIK